MTSFHDYPVLWRGQKALAQARINRDRLEVASLRVEGDTDPRRGQPVDRTYLASDPEGEGSHLTAFSSCSEEEKTDLFKQLRRAMGLVQ